VREALVHAAMSLLIRDQCWCTLKARGMAVAKRRGLRRAIIAVARTRSSYTGFGPTATTLNWSRETDAA